METGRDLWPHTLSQTLLGPDGEQYGQVLSATSVRAGIAAGLIDADDFAGQDYEHLSMLIVQEPDLDSGETTMVCQLLDREALLVWIVGLTQRLVADIGHERARELLGDKAAKVPRAGLKA
jgi:hypothetical protein